MSNDYEGLIKNDLGEIVRAKISSSIILKNQIDCFMEKYQNGYKELNVFEEALERYYSEEYPNFLGRNKHNINSVYAETVFVLLMASIRGEVNLDFSEGNYCQIKELSSEKKLPFTRRTTNIDNLKKRLDIFKEILSEGLR